MENKSKYPRVIVSQRGARHRYAVPRILERHNALERFYTDSHAGSPLGRIATILSKKVQYPKIKRLAARQAAGVPQSKIRATDLWLYYDWRLKKWKSEGVAAWLEMRDKYAFQIAQQYDIGAANLLYSMNDENFLYLKYASDNGLKTIVDAIISPLHKREVFFEKKALGMKPNWDEVGYEDFERFYLRIYQAADCVLCPSEWVAEGVRKLDPVLGPKIKICPYGSSLPVRTGERNPVKGRWFWAGGHWLRKGLHYVAAIADILKRRYSDFEFRAAGITDPAIMSDPRFRNIHFLGKLTREQMEEEFAKADGFVFPTLSEGMAGVVVEAIALGCPVVTTRAAGVDAIDHGRNGLILEPGHTELWAEELAALSFDRERLKKISLETQLLALQFTEEAWGERLIAALQNLTA